MKKEVSAQELIIQVAFDEFSKKPYNKVSIFQIAKKAGMSRTLFYFYFKNKEQLYLALISKLSEMFFLQYKVDKTSNIFSHTKNIFLFVISLKDTVYRAFINNMFEYITPDMGKKLMLQKGKKQKCGLFYELFLKTFPKETLHLILLMLFSVFYASAKAYFDDAISKEQAITQYDKAIILLQKALKEGD